MYWEPEEYRTYKEKHPDTKPWTLVEAEGNWYIMEGWHYVNRLAYLIEAKQSPTHLMRIGSSSGSLTSEPNNGLTMSHVGIAD